MEQSANKVKKQEEFLPAEKKSEALLPLFSAFAQRQQDKIQVLHDKIATQQGKIEKNKAAIERLQHKAVALRKDVILLRGLAQKLPALAAALNAMADRKGEKIYKIEKQKIPARQNKIAEHEQTIEKHKGKIAKAEKKLSRAVHMSEFLKNFGKLDKEARREGYLSGLAALTHDAQERTEQKLVKLTNKLEVAEQQSAAKDKLEELRAKIDQLEQKKNRLIDAQNLLKGVDQNQQNVILLPMIDQAIDKAADTIPETESIQAPKTTSLFDAVVGINHKILKDEIATMPILETNAREKGAHEQPDKKVFTMSRKTMTQNAEQLRRDPVQHEKPEKQPATKKRTSKRGKKNDVVPSM